MKRFQKFICLVMSAILLSLPLCVSAQGGYTPDYDKETPVVIIHGIGQNNTYVLDDEGNRIKDKDGYVTGWPLEIDIPSLVMRVLPEFIASVATGTNYGLSEAMNEGAYDALFALHKNTQGEYEYNMQVPCYRCPMSELPADVKAEYYSSVPVEKMGELIGGEDHLYYFGYDSFGDVAKTAELLYEFITETVLPQTGASKVSLCPISLGGSVMVSFMDTYKDSYDFIKKIVYIVPAIDGSDIVGDLLVGDLSIFDDDTLYDTLMTTILGDTYGAYLINMALRVLPPDVLKEAIVGLSEGVIEAAVRNSTQLWALCPTSYYEKASAKWLCDDEHAFIKERVDAFMSARANFELNQNEYLASGGKVYDICCYDLQLFPLSKNYKDTNADLIIQASSTSMGATFAPLGKTLGESYVAAGTYCSDPTHNHLSPDGMVDPTTGLLPDTTWFFKGQSHAELAANDVCIRLASELLADNNMVDVYSNPTAFPQYNGARNVWRAERNITIWYRSDTSGVDPKKAQAVEDAIDEVIYLLRQTVIDTEAWKKADDRLEKAMVDAKVKESGEQTTLQKLFTFITMVANKIINLLFKLKIGK